MNRPSSLLGVFLYDRQLFLTQKPSFMLSLFRNESNEIQHESGGRLAGNPARIICGADFNKIETNDVASVCDSLKYLINFIVAQPSGRRGARAVGKNRVQPVDIKRDKVVFAFRHFVDDILNTDFSKLLWRNDVTAVCSCVFEIAFAAAADPTDTNLPNLFDMLHF